MKMTGSYQNDLLEVLKDSERAANYLNAALEDGDREVFLLALRDVAHAQGGMSKIARLAKLNRENLYRMLSKHGNPEFLGLGNLLDAMGFKLAVQVK